MIIKSIEQIEQPANEMNEQYGVALRPAFRVYGAGNTNNLTTTVNGAGVLNGNNWAVDYTRDASLNTGNGIFTATVSGLYSVNFVARAPGTNYSNYSQVAVLKSGVGGPSQLQTMIEIAANTTTGHFGASTISNLASGETLQLQVLAGKITFDGNDNWSVAYIG